MSAHQFSHDQIVRYALMLCDILIYLHGQKPYPILYQDMKPDHIYIEGDRIRLVDYGIAAYLKPSGNSNKTFGTRSFASPEQLAGDRLNETSDLYSLGIVIGEMARRAPHPLPGKMRRLIGSAINQNPAKRPPSVSDWQSGWERLQTAQAKTQQKNKVSVAGNHLKNKTIAVVGNDRSIGTTHIAISLCVGLSHICGTPVYYESKTLSPVTERIRQNSRAFSVKTGKNEMKSFIYHNGFRGVCQNPVSETNAKETAGGNIPTDTTIKNAVSVFDCGTDIRLAESADKILYVIGSSLWKTQEVWRGITADGDTAILVNPPYVGVGHKISKTAKKHVYLFPFDRDPFHVTKKKRKLFRNILHREWKW